MKKITQKKSEKRIECLKWMKNHTRQAILPSFFLGFSAAC